MGIRRAFCEFSKGAVTPVTLHRFIWNVLPPPKDLLRLRLPSQLQPTQPSSAHTRCRHRHFHISHCGEKVDNIIAALQYHDRICRITLRGVSNLLLEGFSAARQEPLPR